MSVNLHDIPDHDNRLTVLEITNHFSVVDDNIDVNKVSLGRINYPARLWNRIVVCTIDVVAAIFPSTVGTKQVELVLGSTIVRRDFV
jgi:hypothetical protein